MPATPRQVPARALEALARKQGVSLKGTRRDVIRRVGQKIEPTFDPSKLLGTGPAPPSGSFLNDQFTGGPEDITAHTPGTGGKWSGSGLEIKVEGGYAFAVASTYRYAYNAAEPASADYSVESKWLRVEGTTGQGGPTMRQVSGEDTHYAVVQFANTNTTRLVSRVKGSQTTLAEYSFTLGKGETAVLTISATGTAIKGYINGVERLSSADSSITAKGKAGARFQSEATGLKLDYIVATDTLTEVQSTLTAKYAIRARAARELASLYAIRKLASAEVSGRYALRALVQRDLTALYVLRALAARELASIYAIHGLIGRELGGLYGIRALAQADLSALYALRGLTESELLGIYGLRELAEAELQAAYALRRLAEAELADTYSIGQLISAVLAGAYGIREQVDRALGTTYGIRGQAVGDLEVEYAITGLASAELAVLYGILESEWHAAQTSVAVRPKTTVSVTARSSVDASIEARPKVTAAIRVRPAR